MVRQELRCSACRITVRFEMDFSQDGNHVIDCPRCNHRHYRVVQNGRITDIRYRNSMRMIYVTDTSSSNNSYMTNVGTGTGSYFLRDSWMNSTTAATTW